MGNTHSNRDPLRVFLVSYTSRTRFNSHILFDLSVALAVPPTRWTAVFFAEGQSIFLQLALGNIILYLPITSGTAFLDFLFWDCNMLCFWPCSDLGVCFRQKATTRMFFSSSYKKKLRWFIF